MADYNVQETCSLTIFLSPLTDRECDEEEKQHGHFPELHFRPCGLITNHVNVFMNNKLIRFRIFCHRVCADACNSGSIRFNPLSTEPDSTWVVVRTRFKSRRTGHLYLIESMIIPASVVMGIPYTQCIT